jgi:hypothetical protein
VKKQPVNDDAARLPRRAGHNDSRLDHNRLPYSMIRPRRPVLVRCGVIDSVPYGTT